MATTLRGEDTRHQTSTPRVEHFATQTLTKNLTPEQPITKRTQLDTSCHVRKYNVIKSVGHSINNQHVGPTSESSEKQLVPLTSTSMPSSSSLSRYVVASLSSILQGRVVSRHAAPRMEGSTRRWAKPSDWRTQRAGRQDGALICHARRVFEALSTVKNMPPLISS